MGCRRAQSPNASPRRQPAPPPPPQPVPPKHPQPPKQKQKRPVKISVEVEKYVTVESLVTLIRKLAYWEIGVAVVTLLAQTVAIAASYDFASRSLTGIWTSWFFFISAAVALFWSSRCTFNGLLAVLVLQIIAAAMSIPLFTACCVMFGVYPFVWQPEEENGGSAALVGSSIVILVTNLLMMVTSIAEVGLNAVNAYNCYFLAYVGKPKIEEQQPAVAAGVAVVASGALALGGPGPDGGVVVGKYDPESQSVGSAGSCSSRSSSSSSSSSGSSMSGAPTPRPRTPPPSAQVVNGVGANRPRGSRPRPANGALRRAQWQAAAGAPEPSTRKGNPGGGAGAAYEDPSMPPPPPDITLTPEDIHLIKICGAAGVIIAMLVFCTQLAMFALAREVGIGIGVGFWAAGLFSLTGVITVVGSWNPNSQRIISVFVLQIVQVVLAVPLAGIAYYTVAVFGSCLQESSPVDVCPPSLGAALTVTILGGVMAIAGTMQGLISLVLVLICSQTVCGIRCMISGATVYPTL